MEVARLLLLRILTTADEHARGKQAESARAIMPRYRTMDGLR
jgi:hypothetical protein